MAESIKKETTANVIPFIRGCVPVTRTDRRHRLPAISSAELDTLFDHAGDFASQTTKAA